MTPPRAGWFLVVTAILGGVPLSAQTRAQVAARGVVAVTPPALAAVGDLRFGVVRRGASVTIDPRSSGFAAKLVIAGEPDIEFAIDFGLPDALVAPGGGRLPVRFGPAGGCMAPNDDQTACAPFDPRQALQPGRDAAFFIWLGGSIDAAPEAHAGAYRGVVTATVQYTGV